jgi:chromosome segregation ATPase
MNKPIDRNEMIAKLKELNEDVFNMLDVLDMFKDKISRDRHQELVDKYNKTQEELKQVSEERTRLAKEVDRLRSLGLTEAPERFIALQDQLETCKKDLKVSRDYGETYLQRFCAEREEVKALHSQVEALRTQIPAGDQDLVRKLTEEKSRYHAMQEKFLATNTELKLYKQAEKDLQQVVLQQREKIRQFETTLTSSESIEDKQIRAMLRQDDEIRTLKAAIEEKDKNLAEWREHNERMSKKMDTIRSLT